MSKKQSNEFKMVSAAIDEKPVQVKEAFQDAIRTKVSQMLDTAKKDMAKNLFGNK